MKTSYQTLTTIALFCLAILTPVYTTCIDVKCSQCPVDAGTCTVCKDGYFLNPVTNACSACSIGCKTCEDGTSTKCKTCNDGFFFTYPDSSLGTCTTCSSNCFTCTGTTVDLCTACNLKYHLETNGCVECGKTGTNCLSCNTAKNVCDTCVDSFYLNTDKVCVACPEQCKTCSDGTAVKCLSCNKGFFFTANAAGSKDGTCTACVSNCDLCSGATVALCTQCSINYFLETTGCVECGKIGTSCASCNTTAGICDSCKEGFFLKDEICTSCSTGCKTCTNDTAPVSKCLTCQGGYYWTEQNETCTACISNCNVCTGPTVALCKKCNVKYSLESTGCVECGKTGTNCKVCATTAGTCDTCKDGFFLQDKSSCIACSTGCKTCTDETATTCNSCLDGYFSDTAKTTCTKCPDFCAICSETNTCLICIDFYTLNSTKACVKPDCSKETKKKYILLNDLSCTDCTGVGFSFYNSTYCQIMPAPSISVTVQTDGKVKASFTCSQGKNLYWAYGLAGSAFIGLQKIKDLIKTPVVDPITYRNVGTRTYTPDTAVTIESLPGIKNSGEKYTLFAYCEYLGANSTANTTFNSFNNTSLQTLIIGLTSAAALTSAQKERTASAIATVLNTKKAVWTDEDKPAYALASSRILANSTVNFYILPNYTLANEADPEIGKMRTTITAGTSAFANSVGTKASLTFTGANTILSPSFIASAFLTTIYPTITVNQTGFSFTLKQSGAAGTLFWAYKKEAAKINYTQSTTTETDYAALNVTSKNATATIDTDISVSVDGLTADTSYTVYYYGQNTGLPKIKTPIYRQIITTTANSAASTGAGMLKYGLFFLLAMIMIILV